MKPTKRAAWIVRSAMVLCAAILALFLLSACTATPGGGGAPPTTSITLTLVEEDRGWVQVSVGGVSSNLFGAGFPPKYVPSFSWGGAEGMTTYDPARAIEVARRVMQRRDRELSSAEESVLNEIYALTREERLKAGMK